MDRVNKILIYINLFILLSSMAYFESKVKQLEKDNVYMVEQVKKLDENVLVIEGVLKDQHTINDELVNRLGNYAENVRSVNELLAKLKGE